MEAMMEVVQNWAVLIGVLVVLIAVVCLMGPKGVNTYFICLNRMGIVGILLGSGLIKPKKVVEMKETKVKSGWQVRFAGDWYECQPVGENADGGQLVRLTDSRTHSRVITRRPDEIKQV